MIQHFSGNFHREVGVPEAPLCKHWRFEASFWLNNEPLVVSSQLLPCTHPMKSTTWVNPLSRGIGVMWQPKLRRGVVLTRSLAAGLFLIGTISL